MRCFVAVDITQEVRDALSSLVMPLKPLLAGARWVRPEAQHFTLKFLGEIQPDHVACLGDALQAAANARAFHLRLKGLGAFPGVASARVLWAGVSEGNEALTELARQINAIAATCGAGQNDTKRYVPHLTLARFRVPCDLGGIEVFRKARETEIGLCPINHIVLYRSEVRPDGPVYEPLYRHALTHSHPSHLTHFSHTMEGEGMAQ